MNTVFYLAAAMAILTTLLVITSLHAVHALLYLIVSLLSVALVFFVLGAPFIAALEVIIYAGAIMVLFLFVVMMLNLGPPAMEQERSWLNARMFIGPGLVSAVLLALTVFVIVESPQAATRAGPVNPKAVGAALFGPYVIAVQLAALLLLSGLVGASHLRRRELKKEMKGATN